MPKDIKAYTFNAEILTLAGVVESMVAMEAAHMEADFFRSLSDQQVRSGRTARVHGFWLGSRHGWRRNC